MKMRFVWLALACFLPATVSLAVPQSSQTPESVATPTPSQVENSTPTPGSTPPPGQKKIWPSPPPVIPYEVLIGFLPLTPRGWTSEKPSGSTDRIEVFNLTTASQTYQKGDDENAPVVTVTIIDAGGHKGYFDTTTVHWKNNSETPDGYDKAVEIDGMPGYEHYSKAARSSSLSVVVGKRYFVQIEVTNQPPGELREWLKKMDLKKLAELK